MAGLRSIVLAAGLALLGACASPYRAQTLSSTPLSDVTWRDLIGLSQDQMRVRLGMTATGETLASRGARLDGGVVVSQTLSFDLPRAPCAEAPNGYRAFTKLANGELFVLTFRDGGLSAVENMVPPRGRPPVTLSDRVDAKCNVQRVRTFTEELGYGQGALMLMVPFMLPFTLPQALKDNDARKKQVELFATLRLGEPPPGGAEAFQAVHANDVRLATLPNGAVELNIRTLNTYGDYWENKAVVREGKVVELKPFSDTCALRADLSLACGQTRVP